MVLGDFEIGATGPSLFSFSSPICHLSFGAVKEGISHVSFTKQRCCQGAYDFSRLEKDLKRYFSGKPVVFQEPLLFDRSTFRGKVLNALLGVPHGSVVSYGKLARMAGFPGAARAVGSVMANNPIPFLIPCHRVILGNGKMGFFGPGVALKKRLLTLEGVF